MAKALFFDIDSTLVSFKTHNIPESTIEALTAAKNNGVDIFISTGRPRPLINNIQSISHLVKGYITTNGAYCFAGNQTISCAPIHQEEAESLLNQSDKMGYACIIVGEHDLAMHNPNPRAMSIFRDMLNIFNLPELPLPHMLNQNILQLTPFITPGEERTILPLLKNVEISRWCNEFADITAKGVSKAKGLKEIAEWGGYPISDTIAFGDGGNDLTIIKAAGIGVAMGNANPELKQAADFITTTVDDNGIYNALRHFNVI